MYTTIYFPEDTFFDTPEGRYKCFHPKGDWTILYNNHAYFEAPSYSVRLWVFEMPED